MKKIIIIFIIAIILTGAWLGLRFVNKNEQGDDQGVACAMDAKECPDGSFVSRIPPDCQFAPCPSESAGACQGEDCLEVKLYYYNPELDKDDSGNIACSRDGLVAVSREIPASQSVIQDTIQLLLSGELTDEEKAEGIETEYPLAGLGLKESFLIDGVLTLEFDDPNNKTGGGSCRVNILWAQIEATAKQFEGVEEVRFLPEELFQP